MPAITWRRGLGVVVVAAAVVVIAPPAAVAERRAKPPTRDATSAADKVRIAQCHAELRRLFALDDWQVGVGIVPHGWCGTEPDYLWRATIDHDGASSFASTDGESRPARRFGRAERARVRALLHKGCRVAPPVERGDLGEQPNTVEVWFTVGGERVAAPPALFPTEAFLMFVSDHRLE